MPLDKCPNPLRFYNLGKYFISWRFAATYWATENEDHVLNHWFKFAIETTTQDFRIAVIVWKLSARIGFMRGM